MGSIDQFEVDFMYEILKTVCERIGLKEMCMVDVEKATIENLEKCGYTPSKNIYKAIDKTWANSNREDYLHYFIYKVWRSDDES